MGDGGRSQHHDEIEDVPRLSQVTAPAERGDSQGSLGNEGEGAERVEAVEDGDLPVGGSVRVRGE